jgi:CRP/FNR family transcriptional regulator, nitrogen oxide reductase regulator
MDLNDRIQVFRKSASFADFSDDVLKEIAELAVAARFKKGEFVFREEDASAFFDIVRSGRVKLFKQSPSGKHFIAYVACENEPLCGVVLFMGTPHFLSAQATDEVTILRVKREDYLSFVKRHPSTTLKIIGILGRMVASNYDRMIDVVGERVEQRVFNVLFMLSNKFGNTLSFTCEEVADLSGTTTETVIRIMARLKALRILQTSRGKIRILNLAELRNQSRGPFHI